MEFLAVVKDTPIPTVLVVGGLIFLVLAVVTQVGGKIKVASKRQNLSIVIGIILLLLGIGLYLVPNAKTNLQNGNAPTITGVTIRESNENGELVIRQDINFIDKDGDTNYVKWELANLSDPSQNKYIQITNGTVSALLDEQKTGSHTTGTWHCQGRIYVATLVVYLLDRNGNISEPYRYTIECR